MRSTNEVSPGAASGEAGWSPYRVRTHNPSAQSENRMHSDEVARAHGFRAALVPGVVVFSHLTRPLVARCGERWLGGGIAEVAFVRPAYEGELLTVAEVSVPGSGAGRVLACTNEEGIELARLSAALRPESAAPDARAFLAPAAPVADRPLATWDLMEAGRPFPALHWQPSSADNAAWCEDVRDDLAIYREGEAPLLHPGLALRSANLVLRARFTLPAWIHTASRLALHAALRAGERYEVRAVPEEKWRRNGHEYVRLYVAIVSGTRVHAEILHTAIFRPCA